MKHESILELIGNTPLVRLHRVSDGTVNLWGKVEAFNPMGSVKDRIALAMIEAAEQSGELRPGQTVVEATSGNTGIALAMVCARRGYPLVVVMPENFSIERRKLLRFLGAQVVLTPASEKGSGMLKKAEELAAAHGFYLTRQFECLANPEAHYQTTAREILDEFPAGGLHAFVTGFGTGGTLLGVARALRERSPETRVVVAEPDNSPVLASGLPQPRDAQGKPSSSHPHFKPHLMQGWSPDVVTDLTQTALDQGLIDEIIGVKGRDSLELTRRLAREEGIFTGVSAGATLAAALIIAKQAPPGANIVAMLPDTGERYLSTPLFADIDCDMNDEELRLSRSTPSCGFDSGSADLEDPAPSAPVTPLVIREQDAEAERFLEEAVAGNGIVIFALEWCEYCWTIRRYLDAVGADYRSVDLDSVELQRDNLGLRLRAALGERTASPTIPQVFIAGELVGGCSDVIAAYRQGRLQSLLSKLGIRVTSDIAPEQFLPNWAQRA
ncbi:MAG: cysteine synthase A [Pseudomonadota bacterium]